MKNRIESFDAARGFTVFIMPAVHTVMLYSSNPVKQSWPGAVLAFLAEGPGAQMFMFLMGASVVLGRPKTRHQVFTRALQLVVSGYLLNFIRMAVPASLGILPQELVKPYIVYPQAPAFVSLLLTGDILQMAGLSYLIVWWVYRLKHAVLTGSILCLLIAFTAPFLWNLRFSNITADHIAGLICGGDYRAFFPLFPWLFYPLAGMIAIRLVRELNEKMLFKKALYAGLFLLIGGLIINRLSPVVWNRDFYRSGPGRTIYQTGFVILWLCLSAVFTRYFSGTYFNRLLIFCSRHITSIYLIQWVLIAWGTGLAGFGTLSMPGSLLAVLLTTSLTLGITCLITRLKSILLIRRRNPLPATT